SGGIAARLADSNVRVIEGQGRLLSPTRVDAAGEEVEADAVLLATGARPRTLPTAEPDGERILTWTQLYDLTDPPEHLIVVGSGVTGAEFAGAYHLLGCNVTLISTGEHVLASQDPEAAALIHDVFASRGMNVLSRS